MKHKQRIEWGEEGDRWMLLGEPEGGWVLEGSGGRLALSQAALDALAAALGRLTRRRKGGAKAGTTWTEEEDEALRRAFEAEVPLAELSARHERSRGAIEARPVKLGLLEGGRMRFAS